MGANQEQATIADLQATIEKLTAVVERSAAAMGTRLANIESRLTALEAGRKGVLEAAVERVGAVEGADAVKSRLEEVLVRLVDPETLESLARVAVLAPRLEYAVQAVAAGPELLEEGIDLVREKTGGAGDDRLRAALGAATLVSEPRTLTSLAKVATRVTGLETAIDAAAGAASALEGAYGKDIMRARLTELLGALGDPETLESLARMAALAPRLEYAAQAAAAGPELLEEALTFVKAAAEKKLGSGAALDRRLDAIADAGAALSDPRTLASLTSLAVAAARVSPIVGASAEALDQVSRAEGDEALKKRVSEAVLALADGETLESLARMIALLPRIEYAAQALAAGPELLDEVLVTVRAWSAKNLGDAGAADRRLSAAIEALVTLTEPRTLTSITSAIPALEALPILARHAPRLGATIDRAVGAIDRAIAGEGVSSADLEARLEQGAALLVRLSEPKTLAALRRMTKLLTMVDEALGELPDDEAERGINELVRVVTAMGRPEVLEGVHRTLDMLPRLSETVEALPVEPHTLELLRTVNQAVEEARSDGASIGVWSLFRLLREPEVQATLNLGIDVIRRVGRSLAPRSTALLRA